MTRVTINEMTVNRLAVASPDERAAFNQAHESTRLALGIGEKLRDAREAAGLSQRDLAARVGIGQAALARVEAGHVAATLTTIQKVATELGLRVTVAFSAAKSTR
jgi:ribosome-binding protein aMBF1 (putative translation factor)